MPLATILAGETPHPSLSDKKPQGTGQCRAVHGKQVTQSTLRHLAGAIQNLQQGELCTTQTRPSQFLVIELRHCARRPAQVGAGARQLNRESRLGSSSARCSCSHSMYVHLSCGIVKPPTSANRGM